MITDWLPAAAPSLSGLRRPAPSFSSLLGNPEEQRQAPLTLLLHINNNKMVRRSPALSGLPSTGWSTGVNRKTILFFTGFPPNPVVPPKAGRLTSARMTARSRTPSRRPRFFWRLTAPRAVILELARESSLYILPSASKPDASAPSLPGLRRPAPSFSSLLGNPEEQRQAPGALTPRRHSRACSGIQRNKGKHLGH